jgi:hypothetical protein
MVNPMPRQTKSPALAQDLLMLGDVYLTLGRVAIQRLRRGPMWPWDARPHRSASILTLHPPQDERREEHAAVTPKRG